jgi:hypothetical protein
MARPPAKKITAPQALTITRRRCAKCSELIASNALYPVLVIGIGRRKMVHYHKACY